MLFNYCFQIYDIELENVPEFNKFEDNIKKFNIYGFNKNNDKLTTIAILKVFIISLKQINKIYTLFVIKCILYFNLKLVIK